MDGFKEPSGMLTIFNSFGLIGLAIYNHQQFKTLNDDISTMKQDMNGISQKFVEFKDQGNRIEQLVGAFREVQEAIKFFNGKIEEIEDDKEDERDDLNHNFLIISDAMKSVGNDVKLDKLRGKKKKKKGKKSAKKDKSRRRRDDTSSDDSSDDDDSVRRELDRRRKNRN